MQVILAQVTALLKSSVSPYESIRVRRSSQHVREVTDMRFAASVKLQQVGVNATDSNDTTAGASERRGDLCISTLAECTS